MKYIEQYFPTKRYFFEVLFYAVHTIDLVLKFRRMDEMLKRDNSYERICEHLRKCNFFSALVEGTSV